MTLRRTSRSWFAHLSPEWQVRLALTGGLSATNAVGILVVYALATLVVPMPDPDREHLVRRESVALAGTYVALVGAIGIAQAWRVLHPVVTMLRPGSGASEREQRNVLGAPWRIFVAQALLWAAGSVVFFAQNVRYSLDLGISVFLIVALAGWATCCLTYLISERVLRPVARRVLTGGFPSRRYVRSVANRAMFAWALGTGAAVLGLVLTGVIALAEPAEVSTRELAVTTVVLGSIALLVGWFSSYVAAQASSEPIRNLREALGRVEDGDLDVTVGVYDGTEIGMLQAGFNEMVSGLNERESLRDLFGRHVGVDVARAAVESGVELGGEARHIAVLFVDIIGSTGLAEKRPPEEVVALLNRFFDVVIDVVHEHEGWINKFEGDAALAIWGAPADLEDKPTAVLAAARVLGRRLEAEVPEIKAGIGVSSGTAVAGNVGTRERYEYTVIGDPVNEAARLTNHAKQVPARVVANANLLDTARDEEARHWRELEPVVVAGRTSPTRIATPREPAG